MKNNIPDDVKIGIKAAILGAYGVGIYPPHLIKMYDEAISIYEKCVDSNRFDKLKKEVDFILGYGWEDPSTRTDWSMVEYGTPVFVIDEDIGILQLKRFVSYNLDYYKPFAVSANRYFNKDPMNCSYYQNCRLLTEEELVEYSEFLKEADWSIDNG